MNRRKFISLTTLTTLTWSTIPLDAEDKIINNPWKIESIKEVIVAIYGENKKIIQSDKVKIKAPKLASNGGSIPININSNINAKKILILQTSNKYVLTGIFEVPKDVLVDYFFKVRQKEKGKLTVIIEDKDGLLYTNSLEIDVALGGGCEG